MVDSQVEAMSLRVVEEMICPSSTSMAELADIFCTVTATVPLAVEMFPVSPWLQASSQERAEDLELR